MNYFDNSDKLSASASNNMNHDVEIQYAVRLEVHHTESPYKGKTGLKRVWNALHYSLDGLLAAYKHEDAFRQEVWLAIVMTPLALHLGKTGVERALLVASVLWVMVIELVNSAVEATVDRISFEDHCLAKRAKDIGSAAVLLGLITMAIVWGLVLLA